MRADGLSLLRQVLSAYGIAPSFDSSVSSQAVRFDVDDVDFRQAQQLLRLQTDTFFVPLDPHRVLVAKDTRANRQLYERLLLETIYLPGLNTQELTDVSNLARNVLEITQVAAEPGQNTLTVRGPETHLALFNKTLQGLMDGRSQVLLDVRIYEIQRMRTTNIGVQLPQQFTAFNLNTEIQQVLNNNQSLIQQIISSGLANANDLQAIVAILLASGQISGSSILNQPFAVFGGGLTATGLTLGTTTVNMALNTSDSRAIDQLQLRLQDQESGDILAGMHYPIIQSSYSNLTGGGVNIPGLNSAGLSSQLAALGLNTSSLNNADDSANPVSGPRPADEGHAVYPPRSIRVAQTRFESAGTRRCFYQRHPHPDQPPVHGSTRSEGRRKRARHQRSQHGGGECRQRTPRSQRDPRPAVHHEQECSEKRR